MQNYNAEWKFIELDILRNGMIASDTSKGADNLTIFYSLYKTYIQHNTYFQKLYEKVIKTVILHINEIEFEKDKRGTITGYKSHKIYSEVLENLCHRIWLNLRSEEFISDHFPKSVIFTANRRM